MDMKKIFVMILLLPLFSCNDWLNVESEKSVTFLNYFKSEQDLESTLISMFGYEKSLFAPFFPRTFDFTGLRCDDLADMQGYKELSPGSFFSMQRQEKWGTHYKAIYLTNMLEENRFRFENISEERTDYWIAQANFIKAYMYFDLARNWGDVPLAPGTESVGEVPKSSVDTILNEAIRCAEKALILPTYDKLTDASGNRVASKQYASLGTVHTLLANIYAWMGGLYGKEEYWKKAEEHASLVIDNKVGVYGLEKTIDKMRDNVLGSARNSDETIFSVAVNSQDEERYWSSSLEYRYPGLFLLAWPYTGVTVQDFEYNYVAKISVVTVENMYSDKTDARRAMYWKDLGEVSYWEPIDWDEEGNVIDSMEMYSMYAFIDKWNKPINSTNPTVIAGGESFLLAMDGDRVVWRLADLILLRAECRARLKMSTAVEDLDRIRERAGLRKYSGSTDPEVLRKEIFYERERELFGEGQRYFDIVRNGYYREEYPYEDMYGNTYFLSKKYAALTDEDVKNGALYLPVAKSSMEENTSVKQNTYWLWHQN